MVQVDALLTELAAHSSFSSTTITQTLHPPSNRRPKLVILQSLYHELSPYAAGLLTQIILQDISALLNPPPQAERGMRGLLLEYNQKSRYALDRFDIMRLWDGGTGHMGRIIKVRSVLEEAVVELESARRSARVVRLEVGSCIEVSPVTYHRSRIDQTEVWWADDVSSLFRLVRRYPNAPKAEVFDTSSSSWTRVTPFGQRPSMMASGESFLTFYSLSNPDVMATVPSPLIALALLTLALIWYGP